MSTMPSATGGTSGRGTVWRDGIMLYGKGLTQPTARMGSATRVDGGVPAVR